MHSHRSPPVRAGRANPQHLELMWPRVRPGLSAKRSEAGCAIMIGLQRTTRAMLRVHGCACSSSHAAHSERPVDMRMSCREMKTSKNMRRCRSPVCDSLEKQSSGSGHRVTFEVSSSNLWLRADLPHEGPGNHSVLVNLDAMTNVPAKRPRPP